MLKSAFAPSLNRNIKFGRKQSVAVGPHFRLRNYLLASIPAAPPSGDYGAAAQPSLTNIFGNDNEGDCVIAGGYHVEGVATGNAGDLFIPSLAQINHDYGKIGGYVPGDPSTDNGCDLVTAMNYWTQTGFVNGTKLLGWLSVDGSNSQELVQACYLFEHLYFGMELPDAWVNPFPSGNGFTWDVADAPVPENGHCVMGYGWNTNGIVIDTWAMRGTLTFKAIAEYAVQKNGGEVHVMLTPDMLAKGATKAPNGFAWADLIADFDSMGGNVPAPVTPPPTPTPTPPPPPTPGVVTLAQAKALANAGITKGPAVMTRSMAIKAADAGLASFGGWPK